MTGNVKVFPMEGYAHFQRMVRMDMGVRGEIDKALLDSGTTTIDDLLDMRERYDGLMGAWIMSHPKGVERDLALAQLKETYEQIEIIREQCRQKARAILARRRKGHG